MSLLFHSLPYLMSALFLNICSTPSQIIPGVTLSQASSASFILALQQSVSTLLEVPVSAVTNVTVTANRRMLLSGVIISYTVTVTSDQTPDHFIGVLESSVSDGSFATTLSTNSGVAISSISSIIVLNLSPTSSPTSSPTLTPVNMPSGKTRVIFYRIWTFARLTVITLIMMITIMVRLL